MARIRSIHPGLFTDEAFMSASAHARLLIIGIWTEAWDDGVFEWKPLTLKAKLFPVDNVDMAGLLEELVSLDFVKPFDAGKKYGAIRNFQKYQKPKKPNSSGVLPEALLAYVRPVTNQFPTGGENAQQMEDGEGGEEKNESATALSSGGAPAGNIKIDYDATEKRCREAAGLEDDPAAGLLVIGPIIRLLEAGATLERDILPVLKAAKAKGQRGSTWTYYLPAIERAMKPPEAVKLIPSPSQTMLFVKRDSPEWHERVAHGHKPGLCKFYPDQKAEGWLFPMPNPEALEIMDRQSGRAA